jgi:hypothetical protein
MSAPSFSARMRKNWLKLQTRLLIEACGGLDASAEACAAECRPYSVKQLSRCQNPNAPDLLPIDIVDCLENFCGQHMVTQAIINSRPSTGTPGELRDEASEVTETAAKLQGHIREALADDNEIDPAEAAGLMAIVQEGRRHLDDVELCLTPLMKRGVQ